jgi:hypothetical protein
MKPTICKSYSSLTRITQIDDVASPTHYCYGAFHMFSKSLEGFPNPLGVEIEASLENLPIHRAKRYNLRPEVSVRRFPDMHSLGERKV